MITELKTDNERLCYALGLDVAASVTRLPIELDDVAFQQGIADLLSQRQPLLSQEEFQSVMEGFKRSMQQRSEKPSSNVNAAENLREGLAFLAANKARPGVTTTASGLQYEVVTVGTGAAPKAHSVVSVHYAGRLINGTEFDSSIARGEPAQFPVNGVIPGWTEALLLMKVGGKLRLFIPPELAYGERGAGGVIAPNSALIFDVELLGIPD